MAKKRIEFISFNEFTKLYKKCKDKHLRLAMLLGFGSGLRISEVVGLRAFISKCCLAEVQEDKIEINGRKKKIFTCKKCEEELTRREMGYSKTEWKISPLVAERVDLEKHQIKIDEAKGEKWRITITSPALKPEMLKMLPLKIPRRTLQHKFDKHCAKVLGKKMSFHILRHGFGNHLVNDLNIPLPIVQGYMGHSSVAVTGEYAKANPEQSIKQTWDKLAND